MNGKNLPRRTFPKSLSLSDTPHIHTPPTASSTWSTMKLAPSVYVRHPRPVVRLALQRSPRARTSFASRALCTPLTSVRISTHEHLHVYVYYEALMDPFHAHQQR